MGNCRSNPTVTKTSTQNVHNTQNHLTSSSPLPAMNDACTSALIQAILPIAIPIVKTIVSQKLISAKMILQDEKVVEYLDRSHLPIGRVDIAIGGIRVLDADSLEKDMQAMPEFSWPEAKHFRSLMKQEKMKYVDGDQMVVLDVFDLRMSVTLERAVEIAFPVEGPMGTSANLEVGAGGTIPQAKFDLDIPRIRLWFVKSRQYKLHFAFLARPKIVPFLHVSADQGHGDFFNLDFKGGGGLDDTLESVLCGFGPSSVTHNERPAAQTNSTEKRSWVADALGRRLSEALGAFAGVGRNQAIEIDLDETIREIIDEAVGKERTVADIETEILELQKELSAAKQAIIFKRAAQTAWRKSAFSFDDTLANDEESKLSSTITIGGSKPFMLLELDEITKATEDIAPNSCLLCVRR